MGRRATASWYGGPSPDLNPSWEPKAFRGAKSLTLEEPYDYAAARRARELEEQECRRQLAIEAERQRWAEAAYRRAQQEEVMRQIIPNGPAGAVYGPWTSGQPWGRGC